MPYIFQIKMSADSGAGWARGSMGNKSASRGGCTSQSSRGVAGRGRGQGQFCGLRIHSCIQCKFACDRRATLKRHIRDIHLKRLKCEVCDKSFGRSRRGQLTKHMAEKHGYPVPSSFNVNVPLCESSSSSVYPVAPVEVSVPSYACFLPPTPSPPPIAIPSYFTSSDLFPSDQTPCPSPSSGSWPVESEVLGTPTLKLHGSTPVPAGRSLVSYPYSPGSPAAADPAPSLPVELDWDASDSSPQPFFVAGETVSAEKFPAPDPNSTSSGPLSLFPDLDRFSAPKNFLCTLGEGAGEGASLITSDQCPPLLGNEMMPPPSEAPENQGSQT